MPVFGHKSCCTSSRRYTSSSSVGVYPKHRLLRGLQGMLTCASRRQHTLVLITGGIIQQVSRPRLCHIFGVELVQHAVQGFVVGDLHRVCS